jgi:hypothetical protein
MQHSLEKVSRLTSNKTNFNAHILRFKFLALWSCNLADGRVILDVAPRRVVENSDIVSTNDIGSVTLVSDREL